MLILRANQSRITPKAKTACAPLQYIGCGRQMAEILSEFRSGDNRNEPIGLAHLYINNGVERGLFNLGKIYKEPFEDETGERKK